MAEQQGMEISKYNERGELKVEVREEFIQTGGHFQAQTFVLDVSGETGMFSADYSFPIPVSMFCAQIDASTGMDGDEGEFHVGPDTIVGSITSDVAAGATGINVSSTVTDNVEKGYWISLYDGANSEEMDMVLEVDKEAGTLLLQSPTTNAYSVSTPTYVKQTVKIVPHMVFSQNHRYELGRSRIGGSYIPANTTLRLKYTNFTGTAKTIRLTLEYLY